MAMQWWRRFWASRSAEIHPDDPERREANTDRFEILRQRLNATLGSTDDFMTIADRDRIARMHDRLVDSHAQKGARP